MFSTALYYNRLTRTFNELSGNESTSVNESLPAACDAAAAEERERMMLWVKKERLPMFFRH